jgi:hypothetical protein
MVKRAWVLVTALAWFGCDDAAEKGRETADDHTHADDATLTGSVRDKLVTCGLRADDGAQGVSLIRDETDRCLAHCHLAIGCEPLVNDACDLSASAFTECRRKCPKKPKDGFTCKDGARIPHLALCDGDEDCKGGEDEASCAPKCTDGQVLTAYEQFCDGARDCADGSDESDCLICPEAI